MARPLHMIRVELDLLTSLQRGRKLGLSLRSTDVGYLVHCQLTGLFGEHTPKPFSIRDQSGRRISLLGYSTRSADELRDLAQSVADPMSYGSVHWETLASKQLPLEWKEGSSFNFEVRTSPIQRLGRANRLGKPGAEVDAFLAHCWREGIDAGANRSEVYATWLRREIDRIGGASLLKVDLSSFQLERLLRRTQGKERKAHPILRPVVTFRGRLEVQDSDKFRTLLERGVGRHRAFGLGMLLLRA